MPYTPSPDTTPWRNTGPRRVPSVVVGLLLVLGISGFPHGAEASALPREPVQLTVKPCSLVTKSEATAVIAAPVTQGNAVKTVCTYVASGDGGTLSVEVVAPAFCKLLFLALQKNLFGGPQLRVDVGQGGMLVKGEGNVQFVAKGGCVDITGHGKGSSAISDKAMLKLARTAASRVS